MYQLFDKILQQSSVGCKIKRRKVTCTGVTGVASTLLQVSIIDFEVLNEVYQPAKIMRSSPTATGNNTLLRIQQEISEVAARENELRNIHIPNGSSENGDRSPSPVSPVPMTRAVPILSRAVSTSALNTSTGLNTSNGSFLNGSSSNGTHSSNGFNTLNGSPTTRRFVQNATTRGVMQKFFKSRGKLTTSNSVGSYQTAPTPAWQPTEVNESPAKALIPSDKPLRKGYVPVEERIQKELRELKNREEELRVERRKSQPDLMLALEAETESTSTSRSVSPIPFAGKLRNARSYSHLLDDDLPDEIMSAPSSLRPARSLAELCDAPDEEIESPRTLIQQWELRIKQSQSQEM